MGSNLFANVEDQYYEAMKEVGTISGLSLRAVVEAMIAERMGVEHPARARVRAAWTRYRKNHQSTDGRS